MVRSAACVFVLGLMCAVGCSGGQVTDPPLPPGESVEPTGSSEIDPNVPRQFDVKFETTKGDFIVRFTRSWAPIGVGRVHELVTSGFFEDIAFFRVVPNFMVQFGIHGDPEVQQKHDTNIRDDRVTQSNQRGYVTFAKTGLPDSRSTQLFINYGDNSFLDQQGFAPVGVVVEGMDVVDSINSEYGETPQQPLIQSRGNAYLNREFPNLDYVKKATIISGEN